MINSSKFSNNHLSQKSVLSDNKSATKERFPKLIVKEVRSDEKGKGVPDLESKEHMQQVQNNFARRRFAVVALCTTIQFLSELDFRLSTQIKFFTN
mmetsp:Transcript_8226/g.13769  ORF Transcript_8226/g.13769 Transcript_8226/m.13769 type:complete len:96 (-) Transcript_8226:1451-1738(-)